jgi:hypothetical protein
MKYNSLDLIGGFSVLISFASSSFRMYKDFHALSSQQLLIFLMILQGSFYGPFPRGMQSQTRHLVSHFWPPKNVLAFSNLFFYIWILKCSTGVNFFELIQDVISQGLGKFSNNVFCQKKPPIFLRLENLYWETMCIQNDNLKY